MLTGKFSGWQGIKDNKLSFVLDKEGNSKNLVKTFSNSKGRLKLILIQSEINRFKTPR